MRTRILSLISLVALAVLACVPAWAEGPVDIQILQPLPGHPITGNTLPLAVTFRNPADAQGVYFDSYLNGRQLLFGNIRYPSANTSTFHFRKDVDISAFGLLPGSHKLVVMLRDSRNRLSRAEVEVVVQAPANVRETVPPTVRILSPLNGEAISGATQIRVEATDASGINFVTILVNDRVYGVTNEAPYALAWDPVKLKLPEGDYTITAVALDIWENKATSESVRVRVTNGGRTWATLDVPTTYPTTAVRPHDGPTLSPTVVAGMQPTVRAAAQYAMLPALLLPTAGRTETLPRLGGGVLALLPGKTAPDAAPRAMAPLGALGFASGPTLAGVGLTAAPWSLTAGMTPLRTPLLAPPAEGVPPTRVATTEQPAVRVALAPPSRLPFAAAGISDVSAGLLTGAAGYSGLLTPFAPAAQITVLESRPGSARSALDLTGDAVAGRTDLTAAPIRIALMPSSVKAQPMDAGIAVYPVYDVPVTMFSASVLPRMLATAPHTAEATGATRVASGVDLPALQSRGARGAADAVPQPVLVAMLPGTEAPLGIAEVATVELMGGVAPLTPAAVVAGPTRQATPAPAPVRGTPDACDVSTAAAAAGLSTVAPSPSAPVGAGKGVPAAALADRHSPDVIYIAALPSPGTVVAAPLTPSAAPTTGGSTEVALDALTHYTARTGDTVDLIALAHGTNTEHLMKLNPGLTPARLAAGTNVVVPAVTSARVFLDAQPLTGGGITYPEPYIVNGYSMVPVRLLVEAKGGVVVWVERTQEVNAWVKDTYIGMRIGDRTARVNGETVQMPLPAAMRDHRAMVPLRFLVTALKLDVEYNPASGTYSLISKSLP